MAPALVNNARGTQTNTAAGFDEPITMAAGASIAVGNFLILTAAYDNSGTSGVDPNMFVATSSAVTATPGRDLRGNYWWRVAKAVKSSGAANDGSVADIWLCRVNNAYSNGDAITVQFSFSTAAVVLRISEWSGLRPISYSVVTPTTGTGNGTTIGSLAITPPNTNQLVIGVAAIETNTAITGDADTTNGSWVTMTNDTANTGVDATSQIAVAQYKIVTAGGAQNWAVTKTGASDWAAVAVVFDTFTSVANSPLQGNTHFPCPAGPEVLPVGTAGALIDTGTEYNFKFTPFANYVGSQTYGPATNLVLDSGLPSNAIQQHIIAADLYESGNEVIIDSIESVVLPILAAATNGTIIGGGVAADALIGQGGSYIQLAGDTAQNIEMTFDPAVIAAYYPNHRVVRWGIRYLAWRDNSTVGTPPGEGFELQWRDSRANGNATGNFQNAGAGTSIIGAWLVDNSQTQVQYELRWAGETNQCPRANGILTTFNAASGSSFTAADLLHMTNADQTTGIRITARPGEDPLQTDIFFDYIQMVVELAPERRVGSSSRRVSNGAISNYIDGLNASFWYTATDSATNMTLTAGEKVMAIREALPASFSDYYANLTTSARQIGANEALGPSLRLGGIDVARNTLANQPAISRASISDGLIASAVTSLDKALFAATAVDFMSYQLEGAQYPAYAYFDIGSLGWVYVGHNCSQGIVVNGSQLYDAVKVLCKPDTLTSAGLLVEILNPGVVASCTISVADYTASTSPIYGEGWKEVIKALNVSITPTGPRATLRMSSAAVLTHPWFVSTGLADNLLFAYDPTNADAQSWDFAAVMVCTIATPSLSIGTANTAVSGSNVCVTTPIHLPSVTINNGNVYDYVTVERSQDAGSTYKNVKLFTAPTVSQVFVDYEVPWDVAANQVVYRITGYRTNDHRTASATIAWNDTATAPGAAFGFGSNANSMLIAYVPSADSGDLEVTYSPLNPISKIQLHGYNYQVALRAPEDRGLSITVPVVVKSLGCASVALGSGVTTAQGQRAFSPENFVTARQLETFGRMMLSLPGGSQRYVMVDLGPLSVTTAVGAYIAELEITDALGPVINPWS